MVLTNPFRSSNWQMIHILSCSDKVTWQHCHSVTLPNGHMFMHPHACMATWSYGHMLVWYTSCWFSRSWCRTGISHLALRPHEHVYHLCAHVSLYLHNGRCVLMYRTSGRFDSYQGDDDASGMRGCSPTCAVWATSKSLHVGCCPRHVR